MPLSGDSYLELSSMDNIEKVLVAFDELWELSSSELVQFFTSKETWVLVKSNCRHLNEEFRRISMVGFGKLFLKAWYCLHCIVDLEAVSKPSSLSDVRRTKEDFNDFGVELVGLYASILLRENATTDTQLGTLTSTIITISACCDVLLDLFITSCRGTHLQKWAQSFDWEMSMLAPENNTCWRPLCIVALTPLLNDFPQFVSCVAAYPGAIGCVRLINYILILVLRDLPDDSPCEFVGMDPSASKSLKLFSNSNEGTESLLSQNRVLPIDLLGFVEEWILHSLSEFWVTESFYFCDDHLSIIWDVLELTHRPSMKHVRLQIGPPVCATLFSSIYSMGLEDTSKSKTALLQILAITDSLPVTLLGSQIVAISSCLLSMGVTESVFSCQICSEVFELIFRRRVEETHEILLEVLENPILILVLSGDSPLSGGAGGASRVGNISTTVHRGMFKKVFVASLCSIAQRRFVVETTKFLESCTTESLDAPVHNFGSTQPVYEKWLSLFKLIFYICKKVARYLDWRVIDANINVCSLSNFAVLIDTISNCVKSLTSCMPDEQKSMISAELHMLLNNILPVAISASTEGRFELLFCIIKFNVNSLQDDDRRIGLDLIRSCLSSHVCPINVIDALFHLMQVAFCASTCFQFRSDCVSLIKAFERNIAQCSHLRDVAEILHLIKTFRLRLGQIEYASEYILGSPSLIVEDSGNVASVGSLRCTASLRTTQNLLSIGDYFREICWPQPHAVCGANTDILGLTSFYNFARLEPREVRVIDNRANHCLKQPHLRVATSSWRRITGSTDCLAVSVQTSLAFGSVGTVNVRIVNSSGFKIPYYSLQIAMQGPAGCGSMLPAALIPGQAFVLTGDEFFLPNGSTDRQFNFDLHLFGSVAVTIRIIFGDLQPEDKSMVFSSSSSLDPSISGSRTSEINSQRTKGITNNSRSFSSFIDCDRFEFGLIHQVCPLELSSCQARMDLDAIPPGGLSLTTFQRLWSKLMSCATLPLRLSSIAIEHDFMSTIDYAYVSHPVSFGVHDSVAMLSRANFPECIGRPISRMGWGLRTLWGQEILLLIVNQSSTEAILEVRCSDDATLRAFVHGAEEIIEIFTCGVLTISTSPIANEFASEESIGISRYSNIARAIKCVMDKE